MAWWDEVSRENVARIKRGMAPIRSGGSWMKGRENWLGKTRTEVAENLRKEGWGDTFRSEGDFDKSRYLERHHGMAFPTGLALNRVN